MFTENDFLYYFDQLQSIEKKMFETYRNLEAQITHPEYKKIFARLAEEEKGHDKMVQNLRDIILR